MSSRVNAFFAAVALVCLLPAAVLALQPYNQNFESLNPADPAALSADGWLVYGNVFGPDMGYWYGYGVFPAPNTGQAFCAVVSGEGGAEQGNNQLSVFSDYNNTDHANGAWIEANVFQEQSILAGNAGETWTFSFDAKRGNLAGGTTAKAFIKTLDPAQGYATTNFIFVDMTAIPTTWNTYSVSLAINSGLVGQLFQFGFLSLATHYEGSGVFYDNIACATGTVATEQATWGAVKSLFE